MNTNRPILLLATILLLSAVHLHADLLFFLHGPHRLAVGAEVYHSRRIKEGGSSQTGTPAGWYASYDRIRSNSLYWGCSGRMAWGRMYGHTGSGASIVSNLMDSEVQGRLGYTLQRTKGTQDALTLFVGYGYFDGTNNFQYPSPMTLNYRDYFTYSLVGFLASAKFTPNFRLSTSFQVQFMSDGKSKITNDPGYNDLVLKMGNRLQYQAEIPFTYLISNHYYHFELSLVPFLRYRDYGGRENYPFDFISTQYQIFGGRLEVAYIF